MRLWNRLDTLTVDSDPAMHAGAEGLTRTRKVHPRLTDRSDERPGDHRTTWTNRGPALACSENRPSTLALVCVVRDVHASITTDRDKRRTVTCGCDHNTASRLLLGTRPRPLRKDDNRTQMATISHVPS